MIRRAAEIFVKLFSRPATSACAPGYRANHDTHVAWSESGIQVAQKGSGAPLPPHVDDCGILNLWRTIDFEPAQRELSLEKYVQLAEQCFARRVPAVVSVHSINFHSSLKNFRGPTLQALDNFLSILESKYPNLLYVNDADLYAIVSRGKFRTSQGTVSVAVKQDGGKSFYAAAGQDR